MAALPRSTLAALLLLACAPAPTKSPAMYVPEEVPSTPPRRDPAALPPLTAAEAEIEKEVLSELGSLLALGERAYHADGLDLADATDHVVGRLEAFGYEVRRKGFTYDDVIAQNIEVEVPGLLRGNELVIVSARLDSALGSVGADDNATGVAALLVLARRFHQQRALRTVRFVFFSSAGPRDRREAQGAYYYTEALKKEAEKPPATDAETEPALEPEAPEAAPPTLEVVAALELRGLGLYDTRPGSQRYPENVIASEDVANFVALVSSTDSEEIAAASGEGFASKGSVPLEHWVLLEDDAFFANSAAFEFMAHDFPTLTFTDTQSFRTDRLGTAGDTEAALDRGRLARAVAALEPALIRLSGPRGEAPGPNQD